MFKLRPIEMNPIIKSGLSVRPFPELQVFKQDFAGIFVPGTNRLANQTAVESLSAWAAL
jgi:hypothetical protein